MRVKGSICMEWLCTFFELNLIFHLEGTGSVCIILHLRSLAWRTFSNMKLIVHFRCKLLEAAWAICLFVFYMFIYFHTSMYASVAVHRYSLFCKLQNSVLKSFSSCCHHVFQILLREGGQPCKKWVRDCEEIAYEGLEGRGLRRGSLGVLLTWRNFWWLRSWMTPSGAT